MITFNEKTKIFKLDTANTSYCIGIADGSYLSHVYYGKKLSGSDISYLSRENEGAGLPSINPAEKTGFLDRYCSAFSFPGNGDFREPCIDALRENGQGGIELKYKSHNIFEGKKPLPGLPASFGEKCGTLEVILSDEATGLEITLSFTAFKEHDVIARSVRAENKGQEKLKLTRLLSACMDTDYEEQKVLHLSGAWAREHIAQESTIPFGKMSFGSKRGEPGHSANPFMALLSKDCSLNHGDVTALALVYSGSFALDIERTQFDALRLVIGLNPECFTWLLEPGESFRSPEALTVFSDKGLNGMSRIFHSFFMEQLIRSPWKYRERPVLINSWEAAYFDFDEEKLLKIAEKAAEAGIEMLVCDDGWFGTKRNSADASLGDWTEDRKKFPDGLAAFSKKVHALGLKLGLWFEPEMVSPDSELYRLHPDWALSVKGRDASLCRNQYVLDFSNRDVIEYIFASIEKILDETGAEYIKWDMNRPLTDVGSNTLPAERQGEIWHRHVLGVYEIEERLLGRFPELLIENCSSGGARFDAGMLYYSPQIWCSDSMDAVDRLSITEGTALVYPLSAIGSHVCKRVNDITGRDAPFSARADVAMLGTFGYELDITAIDDSELDAIKGQIKRYRELRGLIQSGTYYRIASYRENKRYDCIELVSADKGKAAVFYFQPLFMPNYRSVRFKLMGLKEDALYLIKGAMPGGEFKLKGDTLMHAGLQIAGEKKDNYSVIIDIMVTED